MKDEDVEEYLKKRLLIDNNQNVNTKFDELISQVKMLVQDKCRKQRMECAMGLELIFEDNGDVIAGIKIESIVNAKEPKV